MPIQRKQTKYGLLSSLAYEKTNEDREKKLRKFDKDENWELLPDYSGRDASVYKSNRTNEIVISVRGTDLKSKDTRYKDLKTDLGIAAGLSKYGKRNYQVTELVKKVKTDFPDSKPMLTGHSLGARIAADVAKKEELPAVVYNQGSSPLDLKWYVKDKLFGSKKHDVTHFNTNKGATIDPVSISASILSGDKNVIVENKKGHHPHSLSNFIDNETDQIGVGKRRQQMGSGFYDRTVNFLTGSNLKDGEMHSILITKDGFKGASYNGPGTRIIENLRNNKKSINETDRISKFHDIRYTLATTPEEERAADLHMLRRLDLARKNNTDYKANLAVGYVPIRAKMLAEDMGIMKPEKFTNYKDKTLSEADKELLREELKKGEKLGYGKKNNWNKHLAKCRKLHPNKSYRECQKLASKSYKK